MNRIRKGLYKTPEGRDIKITDNTPACAYIICDLTPKVREWLHTMEDFTQMPDTEGYYIWKQNLKLYIEVLSWDKVLKDAEQRNKIFFKKLGLI